MLNIFINNREIGLRIDNYNVKYVTYMPNIVRFLQRDRVNSVDFIKNCLNELKEQLLYILGDRQIIRNYYTDLEAEIRNLNGFFNDFFAQTRERIEPINPLPCPPEDVPVRREPDFPANNPIGAYVNWVDVLQKAFLVLGIISITQKVSQLCVSFVANLFAKKAVEETIEAGAEKVTESALEGAGSHLVVNALEKVGFLARNPKALHELAGLTARGVSKGFLV